MANISDALSILYNTTSENHMLTVIICRTLTILSLTIGLLCNVIVFLAFYKQSETEKAYGYQVAFTITQTLEFFCFGTYLGAFAWLDWIEVQYWFVTNYWLIFVFQYLGLCCHLVLLTCSVFLAVAMAADRVFALIKPVVYRNIDHRRHQSIAIIVCFLISVAVNIPAWKEAKIVRVGDRYIVYEYYYLLSTNSTVERIFYFNAASIARIASLAVLIILNTIMVIMFKLRMTGSNTVTNEGNQQRIRKRKAAEKVLLRVNIYQTCSMVFNQTTHVIWFTLCIFYPVFVRPYIDILAPTFYGWIMLTDTLDAVILASVNKKIRGAILSAMPKCC